MQIDLDSIGEGGNPHEKFVDSIRDVETRRKYRSYLRQFLADIPENVYGTVSEGVEKSEEGQARQFVMVAKKKDPDLAYEVIAKYVKLHKKKKSGERRDEPKHPTQPHQANSRTA